MVEQTLAGLLGKCGLQVWKRTSIKKGKYNFEATLQSNKGKFNLGIYMLFMPSPSSTAMDVVRFMLQDQV